MDKAQYVKKILKYIKAEGKVKERIRLDILTDIESKEESGLTIEEIMVQMGRPKEVARDFNQNYPECVDSRRRQKLRVFTIICAALSATGFAVGMIGRFVYLGSSSVSHIGGADRPTNIKIVAEPISAITVYDGLIRLAAVLLLITVLCVVYLVIKDRKQGR